MGLIFTWGKWVGVERENRMSWHGQWKEKGILGEERKIWPCFDRVGTGEEKIGKEEMQEQKGKGQYGSLYLQKGRRKQHKTQKERLENRVKGKN